MDIPIISDTTHALSKAYGVLKEDEGVAYRGLFIIDTKGKLTKPNPDSGRYFFIYFISTKSCDNYLFLRYHSTSYNQ